MLHLTLFNSDGLKLEVPIAAEWNEMELEELQQMQLCLSGQINPEACILNIIQYRLKKYKHQKLLPDDWMLRVSLDDAVIELMPLLEHYLQNNKLSKNPLPQIGNLYGPPDHMDNMLCGEFELADASISLFVIERDFEHLLDAVAVLWRPKMGEKRVDAKDYEPSEVVKSFLRKQDSNILQLIYLWWVGCRQELQELFPLPFGSGGNVTGTEPDPMVFAKAIHNGAGERNGNRAQIRWETQLKEFLFDLQLQLEYQQELDEKYKQNG